MAEGQGTASGSTHAPAPVVAVLVDDAALVEQVAGAAVRAGVPWVEMEADRDRPGCRADMLLVEPAAARRIPGIMAGWRGDVVAISGPDDPDPWRSAREWGAVPVAVLPTGSDWLTHRLRVWRRSTTRRGAVVAVMGATGGLGATSVAAAVALSGGSAGRRTVLVDGDRWGPDLADRLGAGTSSGTGLRWKDFAGVQEMVGSEELSGRLPRAGDVDLLTGGADPAAWTPVLASLELSHGLVVVDLPRYAPETLEVPPHWRIILVVSRRRAAVLAARALRNQHGRRCSLALVRTDIGALGVPDVLKGLHPCPVQPLPGSRRLRGADDFQVLGSVLRHGALGRLARGVVAALPSPGTAAPGTPAAHAAQAGAAS